MPPEKTGYAEPKLGAPGAGLPWFEAFLVRHIVGPLQMRKATWESSVARFRREGERILKTIEPLDEVQLSTRILIPRLQGLEDSSRFWSIAMTLEHLQIVGTAITEIMVELSHDRHPPFKVDTAQVKPKGIVPAAQVRADFAGMLARVEMRIAKDLKNRDSKTSHNHPWFGPLNSAQWAWLIGTHQAIHRRQIDAILLSLR